MHDMELARELQKECARLARIKALPDEQQAPFLSGIVKLERRIDELRAACNMTLDDFARGFARTMIVDKLTTAELAHVDYSNLWDWTYMAGEAWKRGDLKGISDAWAGLRREIYKAKTEAEAKAI